MDRKITRILREREGAGLLRELVQADPLPGGRIRSLGREYFNFSSNDYLGLASHPKILKAAINAVSPAFGSGASRLMCGTTSYHALLEEKVAAFKGKEAALVFNSGYQANVGVISALMGKGDAVFSDRLNHASIIDGIKLSGAKLIRFRHNDMAHLEELLREKRPGYSGAMIVTESVFSMDGDLAPVAELARLKKAYNCLLMVDEAHATGVFGKGGAGLVDCDLFADDVDVLMGTFSKALGSFGGYVAVTDEMKRYLVNSSRSFIYSTALPRAVIAANIAAIEIVGEEPQRRAKLLDNAGYLRDRLKAMDFEVRGDSQIIPIVVGDNASAMAMSRSLRDKGFWVTPVRPPTVPEGEARVRLSLSSDHTKETLNELAKSIAQSA